MDELETTTESKSIAQQVTEALDGRSNIFLATIAELCGITPRHLRNIKANLANPGTKTLIALAGVLDYVFVIKGSTLPPPDSEAEAKRKAWRASK